MLKFVSALNERLARITSSNRFIPEIDGFRFIAIISVLCYHIDGYFAQKTLSAAIKANAGTDLLHKFFNVGNYGVEIFFAISGFILALPFAEQYLAGSRPVSIRAYFLRRLTRIEPPYLIALAIYTVGLLVAGKTPLSELIPHLLASMFYLHNVIYQSVSTICFVAWSLEIEVQFYLLAPLMATVFKVRPSWLRRIILVMSILAASCYPTGGKILFLLTSLRYFLVGFILADLYTTEWKSSSRSPYLWDVAATIGWISLVTVLIMGYWPGFTAPWCILVAFAGCLRGKFWNWCVKQGWVVTIGGMCYTIYLYHPFLKSLIGRLTTRYTFTDMYWLNSLIQIGWMGSCIIACCALLFLVTEKPFMRRDWPRRLMEAIRVHL